jgi:branched-chain amino acid aminotransferase
LTLAREAGVNVNIRPFTREELLRADEVFMTGTAAEVTPLRQIDGFRLGTGKHTLAAQLQRSYLAAATGLDARHAEWLTLA